MSRSCGTLEVVAADVDRGEGAWNLRRTSTMRVNIRVLICDFLELSVVCLLESLLREYSFVVTFVVD